MQKSLKRISVALVIAVVTVCMSIFAACSGKYSVKVECDGEVDYTQITVQWCIEENGQIGQCHGNPIALDEKGKASISDLPELEEGQRWHIQLNKVEKQGYTYDKESKDLFVTKPGEVTIKLVKA